MKNRPLALVDIAQIATKDIAITIAAAQDIYVPWDVVAKAKHPK